MKKEYRKEPWMNPKVEIRSSPIHGKGMFAKAPIDKGEIVAIWGGNYVSKESAEEATKNPNNRVQQIVEDVFEVFLYEHRGDDPTYLHNHSCDPNTWMEDEVTFSARRNIKEHEELTIDYAMFETKEDYIIIEKCVCGSSNCRGRITGKDWRLPVLQKRYGRHFSPLIDRRVANAKSIV